LLQLPDYWPTALPNLAVDMTSGAGVLHEVESGEGPQAGPNSPRAKVDTNSVASPPLAEGEGDVSHRPRCGESVVEEQ